MKLENLNIQLEVQFDVFRFWANSCEPVTISLTLTLNLTLILTLTYCNPKTNAKQYNNMYNLKYWKSQNYGLNVLSLTPKFLSPIKTELGM
jgi:hypothetical protein